ncbi:heparinase II/III family protein [Streptomyces sp. NPDC050738]|uniref:heparinase II/III family protein n=1 Tax=Streptomyces sp. NPDC050738 TaxID=3154744 RepID=UPI003422A682
MTRPTLAELQSRLAATPAVLPFTAESLRKAAQEPHLAPLAEEIRQAAAEAVAEGPLPQPPYALFRLHEESGDRLAYEHAYFAVRRRLHCLALAALTGDDPAVDAALADQLWSVCSEFTWALPAHLSHATALGRPANECVDLFAAETAHALAEIDAVLGDRIPAPVRTRIRTEVRGRVLDPLFGDPRPWAWESYRSNWAAVCAGAAGMAALLLEDDPARLAAATDRCLRAMDVFLSSLGSDGGCAEGLDYWVYGFGYFTYFAEALNARTGHDLLATEPLAAAAAAFPAAVSIGRDHWVPFSDADEHAALPTGLLSRLFARFPADLPPLSAVPALDAEHCYRWGHLSRTLAWTDPAVLGAHPPLGADWLPALAWLTDRRSLGGLPVAFAAKGGHNDEPHNHNDLGHFVLAAGGEQLLADLGAGEYREGYFGPERYTAYLNPSAEGHSLPILDGRPQRAGRDAEASVLSVRTGETGARLALDLSSAYEGGAGLRRTFDWSADGTLTLTDTFEGVTSAEELFISRIAPELGEGTVRWQGSAAAAVLHYDAGRWQARTEEISSTGHRGSLGPVHRLRLSGSAAGPAVFTITVRANPEG